MAADAAQRYGFRIIPFSKSFLSHVRQGARAGVIQMTNPLDLGDVFDLDFYRDVLERALQEKKMDGVLFSYSYFPGVDESSTKNLILSAKELSIRYEKPVALCIISDSNGWFTMKKITDFPIFTEPDDALRALAFSLTHYRNKFNSDLY
jgi:acetyltransferase